MSVDGLDLTALAERLVAVDGVVGVVLGGSRARGTHTEESDVDLGLYYRGELDVDALGALAREVSGPDADVTGRGQWGPWVDGGGWLVVDGVHVDWLYRDLDRVEAAWARTHRGSYEWNSQAGHPMGVPDFAYVGELALGIVLADPFGAVSRVKAGLVYPDALAEALVQGLWEADFLCTIAAKATSRGDTAYVTLCLSRALLLCAHAIHGRAQQWVVNEKGAMASAGRLGCAPKDFEQRVCAVLGAVGTSPTDLESSVAAAAAIVEETRTACATTS